MAAEIHDTSPTISENAAESTFHEVDDLHRAIPAIEQRGRSLRQKSRWLRRCPAAAPRAPVAAGADEVAVSSDRLLPGRAAVAEKLTLVRAHLEQAEVLTVLRARRQPGLAPCHRDGLAAV